MARWPSTAPTRCPLRAPSPAPARSPQLGAGTTILTANNTYTGGTTINAGTLQIGNGGTTARSWATSPTTARWSLNSASQSVLAGIIAAPGASPRSAAVPRCSRHQQLRRRHHRQPGHAAISSDGNLGAPSGGLTLNGGELLPTASFATQRAITLGPGGGSFFTPGGITLSTSGVISGPGALTLTGGGTLEPRRHQHLHRRDDGQCRRLVVNGSIAASSLLSVGPRRRRRRHRHRCRQPPSTAARWRPATRSAPSPCSGNFTQNGGSLPGRGLAARPADRINVTGTATINGGTVQRGRPARQLRQQHDLHHPQRHGRRHAAPTPTSPRTSPS